MGHLLRVIQLAWASHHSVGGIIAEIYVSVNHLDIIFYVVYTYNIQLIQIYTYG